jgi:hypothetical protein
MLFFHFYYCTSTCFAYNFLCVNFYETFSADFKLAWNSVLFNTHIEYLKKKNILPVLALLLTLKPNMDEPA